MKKARTVVVMHYLSICLHWGIFSILTGIICGCMGSAYSLFVQWSNEIRGNSPWLIFFLPAAGLLIVALYNMFGIHEDRGPDLIFDSVRNSDNVPYQVIIASFLSTIITHLFGGSAGRVAVAMQMGGGISSLMSKRVGLSDKDRSLFVMCGMAGLISALFGAPIMATFLSMEVVSLGVIYYAALLPCMMTSMVSFFISRLLSLKPMHYDIDIIPSLTALSVTKVSILAVCCALVSILFCVCMMLWGKNIKKYVKNPYIRILIGSGCIILLTLICRSQTYNGSSAALLNSALAGDKVNPYDFLLKIVFTAITLQSGFKGGSVYPSLVIGAAFGCWFGPFLGLPAAFSAAIGMIAVFCGSVNCPIAAICFAAEVFGSGNIIFFAMAAAISFVFSGYFTIFPGQHFIYSKLRMEYKNSGLRDNDEQKK